MENDTTWNIVLEELSCKIYKDGFLSSFDKFSSLETTIRTIHEHWIVRRKISSWISKCSERKYDKSGSYASKLRNEGNKKFGLRDNGAALKFYTESLIMAPQNGPELGLGFGNRSAALFYLGRYTEAIDDINLAFKYKYPSHLSHKLYQRRGLCYSRLQQFKKAKCDFQESILNLEFVPKLSQPKKDFMIKDLHALLTENDRASLRDENVNDFRKSIRNDDDEIVIEPEGGFHPTFPFASPFIEVSPGRSVTAKEFITSGKVLFVESPFASVLLSNNTAIYCHHCVRSLNSPISCLSCTQARFCSESCRLESWNSYHQFECFGLDLYHSVGLAHLASRIICVAGLQKLLFFKSYLTTGSLISLDESSSFDLKEDRYFQVWNLMDHKEETRASDMFSYAVTALLLTTYLQQKTNFFDNSFETIHRDKNETFIYIATLMLKHILQLIVNGSAIYDVIPSSNQQDSQSFTISIEQTRIATAIFPSASMMNHSCDPSIINGFLGNKLIVRSIKDIQAGSQIFNCYGPHFRRHRKKDRLEMLKEQYHFDCKCEHCSLQTKFEFQDRFQGIKCEKCSGPLSSDSKCMDCHENCIDISEKISKCIQATTAFESGNKYYKDGLVKKAIIEWEKSLSLRKEVLYAHHNDIVSLYRILGKIYCEYRMFRQSTETIRESLSAIKEKFGSHGIEYGHELLCYSDVLEESWYLEKESEEILEENLRVLLEAAHIFEIHYGNWSSLYQETMDKLSRVKIQLLSK